MKCQRCGAEFASEGATDKMLDYNLCILCIMEHSRKSDESLEIFAETKRESHFKM
jgi:hypothetical protein